jgi:adenine-specific DNA-methyltransferase
MQNLQNDLIQLLKTQDNLVIEGELNKNKIVEATLKLDPKLIGLLIKNETFKKHFFQEVGEVLVFDKIKFQRFVNNKSFLPDSYTAFKNKIGLTINDGSTDNYIKAKNDVVLAWPHKDCLLEGGQTKEDQKRNEIFWNETLAPDNIDRLLDAKAFTNFKKYDKDGEHKVSEINPDNNLILKGNNLFAISSLSRTHRGKIKLIYIDPPYNTGSDGFDYNDNFNHSSWLTFIKNRLVESQKLLREDGTIAISIDHNELAYLIALMDEIYGRENLKNIITVKRGSVTGAKVINPGVVNISEYVVIYSKNSKHWSPNRVFRKKARDSRYNKFIVNIEENFENWKFQTLLEAFADSVGIEKRKLKKTFGDNYEKMLDDFVMENKDRVIRFASLDDKSISASALKIKKLSKEDNSKVFFLDRENANPYYIYNGEILLFAKHRMSEIDGELNFGELISDIWNDVLPNDLHNEGGVDLRKGKKPEKLISRIIELCTNENDIVLDFFSGSGTTGTVCLKTNRKFIICEQLEYTETLPLKRLQNTINGEMSGISKAYHWQGGGSFIYAELMQYNQKYLSQIQKATAKEALLEIWKEMEEKAFLSYQFDKSMFNERLEAFKTASLEDMQQYLIEILDKNQLYVNYSEIEDETYKVSEEDKMLNHSFYKA